MGMANIGLRIFLQNAASAGLGAIGADVMGLSRFLGIAGASMARGSSSLAALSAAVDAGQASLVGLQDKLVALSVDLGAAQIKTVALTQAQADSFMNLAQSTAYDQLTAKIAALNVELQAAQDEFLAIEEKMAGAAYQGGAAGQSFGLLGDRLAVVDAEMASLNTQLTTSIDRMAVLDAQNLDRQAASVAAAAAAQDKLAAQTLLADDAVTAQEAANLKNAAALDAEAAAAARMRLGMGLMVSGGATVLVFGAAIKYTVDQAKMLETAMSLVETQVKGATDVMPQLRAQLEQVAGTSKYTDTIIANGIALLGAKGYDATTILNSGLLPAVVHLAQAMNQGDIQGTATLMATALQQFGGTAADAAHYADLLDTAFKNGIPDVVQLTDGVKDLGSVVGPGGLHLSLQSVLPYLDVLTRSMGGSAAQAGADLANALRSIEAPSAAALTSLQNLGIVTANDAAPAIQNLLTILETEGTKTMVATAQNFDGTASSMQNVWTMAKRLNAPGLGQSFYQWALQTGALSSSFFDLQGNFKGLPEFFGTLQAQLSKFSPEMQDAALKSLFGATGLKAIQGVLTQMKTDPALLAEISKAMGQQGSAAHDSAVKMDTLANKEAELHTNIQSLAANIGQQLLPDLKNLVGGLVSVTGQFTNLTAQNPGVAGMLAHLLEFGLAVGGVLLLAGAITVLGTAIAGINVVTLTLVASLAAGEGLKALLTKLAGPQAVSAMTGEISASQTQQLLAAYYKQHPTAGSPGLDNAPGGPTRAQAQNVVAADTNTINQQKSYIDQIIALQNKVMQNAKKNNHGILTAEQQTEVQIYQDAIAGHNKIIKEAQDQTAQVIAAYQKQKWGVTAAVQDQQNAVKAAADKSKIDAAKSAVDQDNAVTQTYTDQRDHILKELQGTLTDQQRTHLLMQLDSANTNIKMSQDKTTADQKALAADKIALQQQLDQAKADHVLMIQDTQAWLDKQNAAVKTGTTKEQTTINSAFDQMVADSSKYGFSVAAQFAQGLNSGTPMVTAAAAQLMQAAKNNLKAGSPTKEGPGRDLPTWGVTVAKTFAQGLLSGRPLVSLAAAGLMSGARNNLLTPSISSAAGMGGGGGFSQKITLNLSGKQLYQVIMTEMKADLSINHFGR